MAEISLSTFSIPWGLAAAALMILIYLFSWGLRYGWAWMQRQPPPTERMIAFIIGGALVGFVCGGILGGPLNCIGEHGIAVCLLPQ
jgi:hypothetical protein